jgi:hypothetical protein
MVCYNMAEVIYLVAVNEQTLNARLFTVYTLHHCEDVAGSK